YSPVDVAQWLSAFAAEAERELALEREPDTPSGRRAIIDIKMQIGLGRFFAAKFKAGVLYALYEKTNDRSALEECLKLYELALEWWATTFAVANQRYASDLSVSDRFDERGQW